MNETEAAAAGVGIVFLLILLALIILLIVSVWKIFTKAGKPGWACIVPIYNLIVFLEIVGRPIWWIILMLIPVVNIIVGFILSIDLAKSFGKDVGYGVGMFLVTFILGIPIFQAILGLGSASYVGPSVKSS